MKKRILLYSTFLFSVSGFAVANFSPLEIKPSTIKTKKTTSVRKNFGSENPLPPGQFPLLKGSSWYFLDNGTDQGATNWNQLTFDNSGWTSGIAPLGYGDPVTTVLSFGPNNSEKFITSYFSKDIVVDLSQMGEIVEFGLRRDDGAVVYLNGVEVFRDNMPSGTINYLTFSSSITDGADEKRYFSHYVPKTAFQEGVNRISVEIHNRDGSSSDIGFDMYVRDKAAEYVCEEGHISCFTSILPTAQTPLMIYPAEQRFQMLFKQGSEYLTGGGTVPGNHDFTGYIPSVGENASNAGHLSVNHENSPGGVSILDISLQLGSEGLNPLWSLSNSRAVDFSGTSLVQTGRNCSGGVTPWGTVITAEESTTSGDQNGDGYDDLGWLVEIDPATAAVRDYGTGIPQKLWAMGRMNHENVVITADGTTAYYGEDGGTHCVYKFIADTPNDFTAGRVYVLKMDLALSNDEPSSPTATWVLVPNTTVADRNNLRNTAAALGGTNFNGVEDCEIGPVDGKIYFASKGKNRIYSFKDDGMTITDFGTFVGGKTYPISTATATVDEPWGDGNDNLAFDDKGNLWVVQDGGRNYIWVVRPNHTQSDPQILLHSSMPIGAEPTGLTFTPDFKYGFFSVQHPSQTNEVQLDATGAEISFNASAALVFANEKFLGQQSSLSINAPSNSVATIAKIYPNPTKGLVTIALNEVAGLPISIEVYDLLGRKVSQLVETTSGYEQKFNVDLSDLSTEQMFIFQVQVGDKKEAYKVMKSN